MASSPLALTIEPVRVVDLPGFAREALDDPQRYPVMPMTPLRAESQSRNPAASAGDVGLLVARIGGACVGYLGLVPALVEDGREQRPIYYLSAFFVDPSHRTTGAGSLLIMKAASLGRDLCVAGLSDDATPVLEAMRFVTAGPLVYLRVRIDALPAFSFLLGETSRRLAAGRLGLLRPLLDGARLALRRTIDTILRPLLLGWMIRRLRVPGRGVEARPTAAVESPPGRAGLPAGGPPRFHRDDATVNWMIRHPWIAEGRNPGLGYAFSHHRDIFRYLPFDLRDPGSGERLGYAVFSVSSEKGRTVLKLLDRVLADPERASGLLGLALHQARRWSADTLELPGEFAPLLQRSWLARAVTQRVERRHLVYTRDAAGPFGKRLSRFKADVCDGDAPFV